MNEANLVKSIRAYLSGKSGLFYWKEHGGIHGRSGIPDIIICYKGKFVALECKAMGRRPSLLQQVTINKIERAGGIAACVWSLDDVKKIIEAIE